MFKGISLWIISFQMIGIRMLIVRVVNQNGSWNRRKSGDAARSLQVEECTNRTLLLFNVRKRTTFLMVPHSAPKGKQINDPLINKN
jgi:hypothetical protein